MKIIFPIRLIDDDKGGIYVSVAGDSIRSWSYRTPDERRIKMQLAHEFAEGWFRRDTYETTESAPMGAARRMAND